MLSRVLVSCSLILMVLVGVWAAACGGGEEKVQTEVGSRPQSSALAEGAAAPEDELTLIVGNLTDETGVASTAMEVINMALGDVVKYYNDNGLIPRVKLKVISYDTQYDPAKAIPGYEWLIEKGADIIWTSVTLAVAPLKGRVNNDRMPLFTAAASMEDLTPPGYVFSLGTLPQYEAYTLLDWIAQNDWDYRTKGPARLGGAAWTEAYSNAWFEAAQKYAKAHPDQFQWVTGYLTNFNFRWDTEVQGLKDCDYIYVPCPPNIFIREFRDVTDRGTFLGTDVHAAFTGMFDSADLWDEADGMLFIRLSQWWNEEGTIIDLTRKLVQENHPGRATEIMRNGCGYLAVENFVMMLEIVKKAVENVGAENFSPEALYDAARDFTFVVDGVQRYSFTETKRYGGDCYGIQRADGERKDLFRVDPGWHVARLEP